MKVFQNVISLRRAAQRVEILCSDDDKTLVHFVFRDAVHALCVPRRTTRTLPGRSLLPSCPAVSRYTPPCDVADVLPSADCHGTLAVQQLHVQMFTDRRSTQHHSVRGGFLRKS
jgi:hypothetical protein